LKCPETQGIFGPEFKNLLLFFFESGLIGTCLDLQGRIIPGLNLVGMRAGFPDDPKHGPQLRRQPLDHRLRLSFGRIGPHLHPEHGELKQLGMGFETGNRKKNRKEATEQEYFTIMVYHSTLPESKNALYVFSRHTFVKHFFA